MKLMAIIIIFMNVHVARSLFGKVYNYGFECIFLYYVVVQEKKFLFFISSGVVGSPCIDWQRESRVKKRE